MFLCTSKKCSYWNILNHTLFSIRHHWSSGFPLLLGLDTDLSLRPSRSPVTCQLSRGWVRALLSLVSMFQACSLAVHPARHCFFYVFWHQVVAACLLRYREFLHPSIPFAWGDVGRGCLLWPVHFLGKTLLVFALFHSVFQGQICLLLQVFLDFLLLHSSPL